MNAKVLVQTILAVMAVGGLIAGTDLAAARQTASQTVPADASLHAAPMVLAQADAPARGKRPARKAADVPASTAGDAQLARRVEQLEEQLIDIQVVLGTLQSLAQSPRGAAPAAPVGYGASGTGGGADAGRVEILETQIRALTQQIERLQDDVRAMGGRRSDAEPARQPSVYQRGTVPPANEPLPRGSIASGGFGSTTVTPSSRDPIGGLLAGGAPSTRTSLPGAGGGSPKDSYETAYGFLLQQNYEAAERAFADFLERFPNDTLAGNAQYWLGETFFVRGNYKSSAEAFLKGYQTYARSTKAPDSLLKLAISLERLGQRDSACATLGELDSRFPQAPDHIRAKAQGERRRVGC